VICEVIVTVTTLKSLVDLSASVLSIALSWLSKTYCTEVSFYRSDRWALVARVACVGFVITANETCLAVNWIFRDRILSKSTAAGHNPLICIPHTAPSQRVEARVTRFHDEYKKKKKNGNVKWYTWCLVFSAGINYVCDPIALFLVSRTCLYILVLKIITVKLLLST
jgi:hypothetical protein